ncbi:PAS-domain containing protein [Ruegeria marina]|uniref:PAS domain-containing protein n=1 Tax=Ruegeria marina TaxID=639004 RepID=A0A1G6WC25_9RHOB|nr:PAS-domain containing protein [Ruegeria marina]SDD63401.1 PAS domain-containing protein [Ruegeria marina]
MAEWLALALICLSSAMLAAWMLSGPRLSKVVGHGHLAHAKAPNHVFLFDGHDLVGTSHSGADRSIHVWNDLRDRLAADFPGFPADPEQVEKNGEIIVGPIDGRTGRDVFCEWLDGIVRVELRNGMSLGLASSCDGCTDPLRSAMDKAPYPVWFLDNDGALRWCNAAYVKLTRKVRDGVPDLCKPLFPNPVETIGPGKKNRVSISMEPSGAKLWFDVLLVQHDAGCLCYAMDINAVVDAEIAQRNFVQTLPKTFAQLSTGLAIFDRNRQLALFNPALVDLTSLPVDFLSSRPSVSSFFDRLRNLNMMPEPKNYGGWRQQMNDLVQAATDGNYRETWSLPSGSVYSVSGRPHPDGAVAFLFEDITAEVTLTRRFRSELELGQAALDQIDRAIAVFSADGTLALSNAAYHQLWNCDPDRSFAQVTVLDAIRVWQDTCAATPIWGDIRDFVENRENRADWEGRVHMRDGRMLNCAVSPIQNGATLVSFTIIKRVSKQAVAQART